MVQDDVPLTEVSNLFAQRGVRQAVLNACQSAKGASSAANMAKRFIEQGVRFAVGMSFNILSSTAEIFVTVLYDSFLRQGKPFPLSVATARQALRSLPQRRTKYGTQVLVHDFISPLLFSKHSEAPIIPATELKGLAEKREGSMTELLFNAIGQEPQQKLFGRDGDMLRLENLLLGRSNAVTIHGPGGIGKTYFLHHLSSWWEMTGLVMTTLTLDLSSCSNWEHFLKKLGELLRLPQACTLTEIVRTLNETRYLIVIQNLQDFSKDNPNRMKSMTLLRQKLIPKVERSLIIFVSRKDELDVKSVATSFSLDRLDKTSGVQLMLDSIKRNGQDVSISDHEEAMFLEHCVDTIQGNPLAIIILVHDFCGRKIGFRKYFQILTDAIPLEIDHGLLLRNTEGRLLVEAESKVNTFCQLDQNSISSSDLRLLAPFWDKLPIHFAPYLCLFDWTFERMAPERKYEDGIWQSTLRNRALRYSELENHIFDFYLPKKDFDPTISQFQARLESCLEELKKDGFLTEVTDTLHADPIMGPITAKYLKVHPVFTLALRQKKFALPSWLQLASIVAYVRFFTYRIQAWPPESPNYKKIMIRLNNVEFANLVTYANYQLHLEPDYINLPHFRSDVLCYGMAANARRLYVIVDYFARAIEKFGESRAVRKSSLLSSGRSLLIRGVNKFSKGGLDDLWAEAQASCSMICVRWIEVVVSWSRNLGLDSPDYYPLFRRIALNHKPGRLFSNYETLAFRRVELLFAYMKSGDIEQMNRWKALDLEESGNENPIPDDLQGTPIESAGNPYLQALITHKQSEVGTVNFLIDLGQFRTLFAETPVDFEIAESTLLRALEEEILDSPHMQGFIYELLSDLMLRKREFDQALEYNRLACNRRNAAFIHHGLSAEQLGRIRNDAIQFVRSHALEEKHTKNWCLSTEEIRGILRDQSSFRVQ